MQQGKIIRKSRRIGNTTLYRLNKQNMVVQKLIELDLRINKDYADLLGEPKPAPS